MTEAEWLDCTDPGPMYSFLRDRATSRKARWLGWFRRHVRISERKLRLLACAYVRQVWPLLDDERSRKAVESSELFADGKISKDQLRTARDAAGTAAVEHSGYAAYAAEAAADEEIKIDRVEGAVAQTVVYVCEWEVNDDGSVQTPGITEFHGYSRTRGEVERQAQAALLRCIFGNPFHPPRVKTAWLSWSDGTIPKLVQGIYADRAFDRLPVLADALEDAGCDNAAILAHCRGPGPHVRGCWVVDLLLDK